MTEQRWEVIPEFPDYAISDRGQVYNIRRQHGMRISYTTHGHAKITLLGEDGERYTRSVATLVAEAFVERPNYLCNQVIVLDGDFTNLHATNLAWRPVWFAWKYTHQLKMIQPIYYRNLIVHNVVFDQTYESIVVAGISEGLLFDDIWESTCNHGPVYPHGSVFEVVSRV